jgi:hypothetical protein
MRFILLAACTMLLCIGQPDAKPKKSLHLCTAAEIQGDSRLKTSSAKACLDNGLLNGKNTWLGCGPGSDVSCCTGDREVAICDPLL